jgi:hypothetical protein
MPTNWDYTPPKVSYSNFTGWGPSAPLSQAGKKQNAFALANQPRISPLAQDRYNALNQKQATSSTYQPGMGGNTSLDPNANSPFGGANISTGFTAGALPPQALQASQSQMGFGQAPGVSPGGAGGYLNQMFNDMRGQTLNAGNTDMTRKFAHENSILDLASQRARADDTIGWGELFRRMQEMQYSNADFGLGLAAQMGQGQ